MVLPQIVDLEIESSSLSGHLNWKRMLVAMHAALNTA